VPATAAGLLLLVTAAGTASLARPRSARYE
jgi:hypothetical protein